MKIGIFANLDKKIQEIETLAHDGIFNTENYVPLLRNITIELRSLRRMLRELLPQVPAKTANEGEGDAA